MTKHIKFNIEYKTIILDHIKKYDRTDRPTIYSNEYFLDHIYSVLNDVVSWRALGRILCKSNPNLPTYHYSTIRKKFEKWNALGIFKKSYDVFVKLYGGLTTYTSTVTYIDGTMIYNKYGVEEISINPADKKKKATKITILTTTKNNNFNKCIPIGITSSPAKIHDVHAVLPTVEMVSPDIRQPKMEIFGDKGYMLNQTSKKVLKTKGVTVVTPPRKNAIDKVRTKRQTRLLRKRYGIENCFSYLKNYNRICIRRDKSIKNYLGFIYMGCMEYLSKNYKKN